MAFSLTEKLAVAGAFLAFVAMAVGTEEDPGVVAMSQDEIKSVRLGQTIESVPQTAPTGSTEVWWPSLGRTRDAAAEDRAGSAKVLDTAPEPPSQGLPPGASAYSSAEPSPYFSSSSSMLSSPR